MPDLFSPLTLRSGATLPNRIAKAAMEEGLAGAEQAPDARIVELYRRWGAGGTGLLVTGNVMVHAEALTGPGAIVLDARSPLQPFRAWAAAAKQDGASVWMQISHPGRQIQKDMPGVVWAPSAKAVDLGSALSSRFATPTAMTEAQIRNTVARFATTARRAEEAGFDGVEVHAAHGYLLSQFLSPLVNTRTDEWGGPLENRARLLLDVVRAIRAEVAPDFAVAVKLNSADFQRGGFDATDAQAVIAMLAPLGVDLVEVSGGSYESPAMTGRSTAPAVGDTRRPAADGRPGDARSVAREAYFLELAADLAVTSEVPLMLTGGITRRETAEAVLAENVAVVGIGTALAVTPDLPARWRAGTGTVGALRPAAWKNKPLASMAQMGQVRYQLRRMAAGKDPRTGVRPVVALLRDLVVVRRALGRYRRWLAARPSDGAALTAAAVSGE